MNHEIMLYAIAQKEQLGFDKAVEECKYRMSRYGVQPNMLVLPPQMLLYMALAPEQKLTYKEGGPAAEARFDAGVAGFEARAFRGCGVFTSGARSPTTTLHTGVGPRPVLTAYVCTHAQSRSRSAMTLTAFRCSPDRAKLASFTS